MAAPPPPNNAPRSWTIALHGGAGVINADDPAWIEAGLRGLRLALRAGADVLRAGGGALDAVEAAVVALEDDPLFNAGRGSVLTRAGRHELEASVMVADAPPSSAGGAAAGAAAPPPAYPDGGDGSGRQRCGAAALLGRVKNPVRLARCVMERTAHTFMAGPEAEALAARHLGPEALVEAGGEDAYFGTETRRLQWRRWKAREAAEAEDEAAAAARGGGAAAAAAFAAAAARPDDIVHPHAMGTVGAVAVDGRGALAAATSTGGRVGKLDGRVGDTPVCGAGNWADGRAAVSGTGVGEAFARRCAAKDVAARVRYGGAGLAEAAGAVVFGSLAPGDGGVVAVGSGGEVAMPFNSPGMWRACADSNGRFEVGVFEGMEKG
jgi:beta-aspartyl-peptidase (threonine type)